MSTTQIHDELPPGEPVADPVPLPTPPPLLVPSTPSTSAAAIRPAAYDWLLLAAEAAGDLGLADLGGRVAADVRRDADPAGVEDLHPAGAPQTRQHDVGELPGRPVVADGLGQHDHLVERARLLQPAAALSRRFSSLWRETRRAVLEGDVVLLQVVHGVGGALGGGGRAIAHHERRRSAQGSRPLSVRGMTLPNP